MLCFFHLYDIFWYNRDSKKTQGVHTNERIIPASGLAAVGTILGKSDFVKRCNRMDVTKSQSQHQIKYPV